MGWKTIDNIRGPRGKQGPAGTISSVTIAQVPNGTPPSARVTGVEDVNLHLELPLGNEGKQGPPGLASSASAVSVPYGEPAAAVVHREGELAHVSFKIPGGAPAPNAIPTAEAIGQNLSAPESAARPGLESGMAQVASDPGSEFAIAQQAQIDASISSKADLEDGTVPDSQLGAGVTATPGTIPKRDAGGRLPGVNAPTANTHAANKAYVDTSLAGVSQALETFKTQVALAQDLVTNTRIDQNLDGTTAVTSSVEFALMYAPQPIEITGVTLVFDNQLTLSGATNWCLMRIVHRANTGATAIDVVQKSSQTEALGGAGNANRRKPWSMSNGTWGSAADRRVPAGNVVSLVFVPTGTVSIPLPVMVSIEWRPVR